MRISELIAELEKVKQEHGDLEMDTEYHCGDCNDSHEGPGLKVEVTVERKVEISAIEIWDD